MYSKDELKNLKLEFWESFAAFCEVQPYLRGRKKTWVLYDTKVKGVELKVDATREGAFVIIYIVIFLHYLLYIESYMLQGLESGKPYPLGIGMLI